jgi:hypothetical protein
MGVKKVVLLLVVANAVLWLWWQGGLSPLLEVPGAGEREPLRAARQLRVESIAVAPSAVAASASVVVKTR